LVEPHAVLHQPVQSRDAHVINRFGAIAHHLRADQRLFRHGDVTRPRRHHEHEALARALAVAFDGNHARKRIKHRLARHSLHGGVGSFASARD